MITLEAALQLLGGFGAGLLDAAEAIACPLLAVDVDSRGEAGQIEVPAGFPAVVVAVCRSRAPALSPRGPDVALTAVSNPPAPWVGSPDPEAALDQLADRIAAAPGAAVALVEVLRAGRGRTVEEGLVLESLAYSMLQGGPEFARWRAAREHAAREQAPDRTDTVPPVLVRRTGEHLEITLNRPHVHNAYNRRMRDELCEVLATAAADPTCRVSMSGAGPSFCSGGDLDEFGTSPDPVSSHLVRSGRSPARLLDLVSGRTVVVLHGACAGSGIELPAFTGTVLARPGTRMWLPELGMGLIPGAGGTVSLARRIGPARTAWMGLSGLPVDVPTALAWGLVDGLAPASGEGE